MSNNNGIPATALPPRADASYVERMVQRAEQGGATFDTPTQAEFAPPAAPEFRSRFGSPKAAAAASAGDLLIYNAGGTAMEIEVSQAVTMGLIRPAAGGGFEGIPTTERQLAEQAQRQEEEQERQKASVEREAMRATGDEPSRELQAAIDRANASVPGQVITSFVEDYVKNGSLDYGQFVRATRSAGLSAEHAEAMATGMVDGFRQQADLAVATQGIPVHEAEALYAWAAEHYPSDHRNAVRALVLASDAAPLKALARKYSQARRGDI